MSDGFDTIVLGVPELAYTTGVSLMTFATGVSCAVHNTGVPLTVMTVHHMNLLVMC